MGDWQPIETAPKDGSSVLAFQHFGDDQSPFHRFRITSMRWDAGHMAWRSDCHSFVTFEPTFWQPLPEPPQ